MKEFIVALVMVIMIIVLADYFGYSAVFQALANVDWNSALSLTSSASRARDIPSRNATNGTRRFPPRCTLKYGCLLKKPGKLKNRTCSSAISR